MLAGLAIVRQLLVGPVAIVVGLDAVAVEEELDGEAVKVEPGSPHSTPPSSSAVTSTCSAKLDIEGELDGIAVEAVAMSFVLARLAIARQLAALDARGRADVRP